MDVGRTAGDGPPTALVSGRKNDVPGRAICAVALSSSNSSPSPSSSISPSSIQFLFVSARHLIHQTCARSTNGGHGSQLRVGAITSACHPRADSSWPALSRANAQIQGTLWAVQRRKVSATYLLVQRVAREQFGGDLDGAVKLAAAQSRERQVDRVEALERYGVRLPLIGDRVLVGG